MAPSRPKLCRFTKSYKYKHKPTKLDDEIKSPAAISCDSRGAQTISARLAAAAANFRRAAAQPAASRWPARLLAPPLSLALVSPALLLLLLLLLPAAPANAFCPSVKCVCDDRLLSVNCTSVPSISHIPITLNPLLRRLTLTNLALSELSNSLAVYRQLEFLDLRANHLRQVRYEHFNLRPAPASSLHLKKPPGHLSQQAALIEQARHRELIDTNEQLARHLKQTIERGLSDDEIRFHLRELLLAENQIEQLGSGSFSNEDSPVDEVPDSSSEPAALEEQQPPEVGQPPARRLRAGDLERQAPFLSLTRLEVLDLSSNRLRRLQQHVFLGLVQLRRLDLSQNLIAHLDRRAFVGLLELRQLSLNQNHLVRLLPHLGAAFCNAPMNRLQWLELAHSLVPGSTSSSLLTSSSGLLDSTGATVSRLPNQMFICAPHLEALRLEALQLRYIQVNAFDNLQRLVSLSLAGNYLEQVPTSSLSYSNSNLSQTLRQLDLSQTLIEFVNAHSLASLKSLQHLSLSHMARLVSFDMAALHFEAAHLESAPPLAAGNQAAQSNAEHPAAINHRRRPLINDQLVELHLAHNARLQSVHSSAAPRRLQLNQLRRLNLAEAPELRELPLAQMLELPVRGRAASSGGGGGEQIGAADNNLRVDLWSSQSGLNCSSCHMGWLLEAATRQLAPYLAPAGSMDAGPGAGQQPAPEAADSTLGVQLARPESLACQLPEPVSLLQFLSRAAPSHGRFTTCQQEEEEGEEAAEPRLATLNGVTRGPRLQPQQPEVGWLPPLALCLAALLSGLLLLSLLKLGAALIRRHRRQRRRPCEGPASWPGAPTANLGPRLKWSPGPSVTGSGGSPAGSSAHSSSLTNSGSPPAFLLARAGPLPPLPRPTGNHPFYAGHLHERRNLLSRLAGRLARRGWLPWRAHPEAPHQPRHHHRTPATLMPRQQLVAHLEAANQRHLKHTLCYRLDYASLATAAGQTLPRATLVYSPPPPPPNTNHLCPTTPDHLRQPMIGSHHQRTPPQPPSHQL